MAKQKIAVIGLGQFGLNLSLKLTEVGVEVLSIDLNSERVDIIRDQVAHAVIADASDFRALEQLGLKDFDIAVVAIGDNFEASLLTAAHLQDLRVPRIICRTLGNVHEKLLKLMKIDEIIVPEGEAAYHLAKTLSLKGVTEHLEISDNFSIIETYAPSWMHNKTLQEIDLRKKYKLNLITILRNTFNKEIATISGRKSSRTVIGIPEIDMKFASEDMLVLFGHNKDIQEFLAMS